VSYSDPRTWVTGELVTASLLNVQLRDQLDAIIEGTTGAYVNAVTGPHAIGGSTVNYVRLGLTGAFTSGGASTVAFGTYTSGVLTGHSADSAAIAGVKLNNTIVTAGNCTTIAQLWVSEPQITVGAGSVTNSASIYVEGSASEATNDYAIWVDAGVTKLDGAVTTGSTVTVGTDLTVTEDIVVSGAGPHAFGAVATDYIRTYIAGNYTSGGSSTSLIGLFHAGALTGHVDDSAGIAGMRLDCSTVTAGSATLISQLSVNEPQITVGAGTVTTSASVYIQGAATEATSNFALWVDSGATRLDGNVSTGGAPDGYAAVTLRNAFTSDGSSSVARGVDTDRMTVTGVSGDTTHIVGSLFSAAMTVQNVAETVVDVAQVMIDEPAITKGAAATITNSSSLKITGAASEATNNFALWVDSGVSRFDGFVQVGTTAASTGINSPKSTYFNCDSNADATGEVFIWGTNRATTSGGTELMRLTDGGLLGLGESDPQNPLHITTGTAGAVTILRLQHDNSSTNDAVSIDANMTSDINTSGQINFKRVGTNAATDIIFSNTNTTGGLTERVRFTHDGNFGIGLDAPARTLSVHRDDTYAVVQITNNGTGVTSTDGFQLQEVGANAYVYNYENGNMSFGTNALERMTIANSGAVAVVGAFSKGSGSFKIDHPLPAMNETHDLIHSFVEGPRADLIYRGTVVLVDGSATVDLDVAAGMTVGTWVLLCRDEQVFTTNETSYNHIRGSVSGSTLTIECEEATCTDSVSWMVVAERQDQHMLDSNTEWTDDDGRPIIEPLKTSQSEPAPSVAPPTTEE
jgi:hypothetical protein